MNRQDLLEDVKLCLTRGTRSDFLRDAATDAERAALSAASPPVTAKVAQDYAAWRRSVLYLAVFALGLLALLQVLGYETVEDQMVKAQVKVTNEAMRLQHEQMQAQQPEYDMWGNPIRRQSVEIPKVSESDVRKEVKKTIGSDNIDTLEMIPLASILSVIVAAVMITLAARCWSDVRKSRRLARRAWYFLIGTPLVLALIPWSRWVMDFKGPGAAQLEQGFGAALGFSIFMMLAPKVVTVFPGLIRSSVALKSMLHESPTPGYVAAIFAPVYAIFLVVAFTTINQIYGNVILLIGLGLMASSPLVYIYRGADLLRPHNREEAKRLLGQIRMTAGLLNIVGALFIVIFIFDLEHVNFFSKLEFVVAAVSSIFLMLVVGGDFVVALVVKEFEQAVELHTSGNAPLLQAKIDDLIGAGLGKMRTSDEIKTQPPVGWGSTPTPSATPSEGGDEPVVPTPSPAPAPSPAPPPPAPPQTPASDSGTPKPPSGPGIDRIPPPRR